jgi:hypothetical protein
MIKMTSNWLVLFALAGSVLCGPLARPVIAQDSGDKACDSSDKQRAAAARVIRAAGYDCKTADSVCPYIFSEGFTVSCNHYRYVFEIENHGGRWSITAK